MDSKKLLIAKRCGFSYAIYEETIFLITTEKPFAVLSSAVLGGGLRRTKYIFNHTVSKDYDGTDPRGDLMWLARNLGIGPDAVGLMTAVPVHETQVTYSLHGGLGVMTFCTAGCGNAWAAGLAAGEDFSAGKQGTINLIVMIDGNLTDSALVNAVMTIAEAKVRALRTCDVFLACGEPATGTNTDAVAVACSGKGPLLEYAGTATELGYLIGSTVYDAVRQGISRYRLVDAGMAK